MPLPRVQIIVPFVILLATACSDEIPGIGPGTAAGWPAYGATPGGGHYSPADQITPANVRFLEQVWVHNSGDYSAGGQDKDGRRPGPRFRSKQPVAELSWGIQLDRARLAAG